jgi:molybdenum cofactor cytidylyltransferase
MIAGVLLAAGQSQRMGQPKQLLPWQGVPLVRHAAMIALRARLDELVVVVGAYAAEVRTALDGLPLRIVANPAYAHGQSISLRLGIDAVADAHAAVVLLCDQPLLQPATINRLIDAFDAPDVWAVIPTHAGQRGNPVLLGQCLFAALATIEGDMGARQVLRAHADRVRLLELDDAGVITDLDTPTSYDRVYRARHGAE